MGDVVEFAVCRHCGNPIAKRAPGLAWNDEFGERLCPVRAGAHEPVQPASAITGTTTRPSSVPSSDTTAAIVFGSSTTQANGKANGTIVDAPGALAVVDSIVIDPSDPRTWP